MTRSALSPRKRVGLSFEGEVTRTKQSMKAECDINNILAKYQKTGAVSHLAKHGGSYGFAPALDFHSAVNLVQRAQGMFDDLPASLRRRFNNDPGEFLAFIQDPANTPEAIKLGLATARQGIDPATGELIPPPLPNHPKRRRRVQGVRGAAPGFYLRPRDC